MITTTARSSTVTIIVACCAVLLGIPSCTLGIPSLLTSASVDEQQWAIVEVRQPYAVQDFGLDKIALHDLSSGEVSGFTPEFLSPDADVTGASATDSGLLAVATSDGLVTVLSLNTQALVRQQPLLAVALQWSADGTMLGIVVAPAERTGTWQFRIVDSSLAFIRSVDLPLDIRTNDPLHNVSLCVSWSDDDARVAISADARDELESTGASVVDLASGSVETYDLFSVYFLDNERVVAKTFPTGGAADGNVCVARLGTGGSLKALRVIGAQFPAASRAKQGVFATWEPLPIWAGYVTTFLPMRLRDAELGSSPLLGVIDGRPKEYDAFSQVALIQRGS